MRQRRHKPNVAFDLMNYAMIGILQAELAGCTVSHSLALYTFYTLFHAGDIYYFVLYITISHACYFGRWYANDYDWLRDDVINAFIMMVGVTGIFHLSISADYGQMFII